MPETNDVISHLYYDLNDKINDIDTRVGDTETRLDNIDIAEATEPKVYVALLTQTGTNAPVATVLKNTLGGAVVWTYDDVGSYIATLSGVFVESKTWLHIAYKENSNFVFSRFTNSDLQITCIDNGELLNTAIKIEVYP